MPCCCLGTVKRQATPTTPRRKERKREKGKKNKRKISRKRERVISKVIRVMREKGADEQKGMGD